MTHHNALFRTARLGSLLTLALAACGKAPTPGPQAEVAPVRLTAALPAMTASGGIASQAVPQGTTSAELSVFDGATELLFDANGHVSPTGSRVGFTPAQSTRTVFLPVNKSYDFKVKGLDDRTPANTLAYGEQLGVNVGSSGTGVNLALKTFVGGASLRSMLGVTAAEPGQVVDVALNVSPNGRPDLFVPEGDFTVSYSVLGGTVVQQGGVNVESRRGVRVQAAGGVPLQVAATVTGLRAPLPGAEGTLMVVLDIPVAGVSSGVGVDITTPTVTLNVDANPSPATPTNLSGSVSDDVGIQKVEVYDGAARVGQATVTGSSWSMTWTPTAGDHDLQVLAYDAAGNVGRARKFTTTRFTRTVKSVTGGLVDIAAKGEYVVTSGSPAKVYKLTAGTWQEQATLGNATYVDTDGTNILLSSGGFVTVYRQNGTWTNEATLSNASFNAAAGRAVVSRDYVAVGAPTEDGGKGAVYVYKRGAGSWTPMVRLPGAASGTEGFGTAVSISGHRLAVGAPGAAGGGSAYVFELSGGVWSLTDTLTPGPSGGYGQHVDLHDDQLLVGSSGAGTAVYAKSGAWQRTGHIGAAGRLDQAGSYITVGNRVYRSFEGTWVFVNTYGTQVGFTADGAVAYFGNTSPNLLSFLK